MLLESLSQRARVSTDVLRAIANSADRSYKVYTIDKRSGGKRTIYHPSRSLKSVQRYLVNTLVSHAPVHSVATAYKKGSSIRDNASRHAHTRYTLRLDFKDFFPSFDVLSVRRFLKDLVERKRMPVSADDLRFAEMIFCRRGGLTIGAPSSPALTNAMMFDFDDRIYHFCEDRELVFTRYADDLFISGLDRHGIDEARKFVEKSVSLMDRPVLILNKDKTLNLSLKGRRSITGIVLTSDGQISLGRDRKRMIKTLVYKSIMNLLPPEEMASLAGLLSFAHDIEPEFIDSLSRKFETDVTLLYRKNALQRMPLTPPPLVRPSRPPAAA